MGVDIMGIRLSVFYGQKGVTLIAFASTPNSHYVQYVPRNGPQTCKDVLI